MNISLEKLVVIIIALFGIEFYGNNGLTIFRIIILPLIIIFFAKNNYRMPLPGSLIIFILIVPLATRFPSSSGFDDLSYHFFQHIANVIVLVFGLMLIKSKRYQYSMLFGFAILSLPHLLVFPSYLFDGGLIVGVDDSRYTGLHYDPNFLSFYCNVSLISTIILIRFYSSSLLLYIIVSLNIVAITFSLSRAGIIVACLSIFYWLTRSFHWRSILIIPLIVLATIQYLKQSVVYLAMKGRIESGVGLTKEARADHISNIWRLFSEGESIFTGFGVENYRIRFNHYSHNLALDFALDYGLWFLVVIFFLGLISVFMLARKKTFNSYALIIGVISLLSCVTLSSSTYKFVWLLLSCVVFFPLNMIYGSKN